MADEDFKEPTGADLAGTMVVRRIETPYERYMDSQGIPIYRGPGVHDIRELTLKPWDRFGGNGAFLDLDNTTDLLGMHVLEIPPGGVLNPVRQCYEEKYWVVEGEGTTELSLPDGSKSQRFEWHANSLFAIPMNTSYRLVNATRRRALLLAGNTAPPIINTFDDEEFIFDNEHAFRGRYDGSKEFYKPNTETLATPELGRAMWRTNLVPDIVDCELPLDNQRSPGYRRIEPTMAGGYFWCFIGEHVPGRYSKAHSHSSGAVLICVKGSGYTYNWPQDVGTTPWADGKEDAVERVDYVPGGMVAAAPGGGGWFHQHFSASSEPLRFLVFYGGAPGSQYAEYAGKNGRGGTWLNVDIEDGGHSISYRSEDPHIREEYKRMLGKNGVEFAMSDELFEA